jgi:hypothetical protein
VTESSSASIAGAGTRVRRAMLGVVAAVAALALTSGPTLAAVPPVFNNIPTTLPGNLGSVGFEATSTTELGDLIELGPGTRSSQDLPVTVVLSVWACEKGGNATCVTTPGATWSQPLTLTIYSVDHSGPVPAVGSTVLSVTTVFDIPFRPSFDPTGPCAGKSTGWWPTADKFCYNGMLHPVTFTLPQGLTLPEELIWGISFTTGDYGPGHTGIGGYWNSLNVAVHTFPDLPPYGTDVEPSSIFIASTADWVYQDGDAGDGLFRDDQGGWAGLAPLACFGADCAVNDPLATPRPSPPPTPTSTATATAVPTATPADSPTVTASPSATPFQSIAGATGVASRATPPATNAGGDSSSGSSPLVFLLLFVAFGAAVLTMAETRRRNAGR